MTPLYIDETNILSEESFLAEKVLQYKENNDLMIKQQLIKGDKMKIMLNRQKNIGIQPDDLDLNDIDSSFYNGAKNAQFEVDDDSDSSLDSDKQLERKIEIALSRPLTYWVVISEDN